MKDEKMQELHGIIKSWCILNDISPEILLHILMVGILGIFEANNLSIEDVDKIFNGSKKIFIERKEKI